MKIIILISFIFQVLLSANLYNVDMSIKAECNTLRGYYTVIMSNDIYDFDASNRLYRLRNSTDILDFNISKNIEPLYMSTYINLSPLLVEGNILSFNVSSSKNYTNVIKMNEFNSLLNTKKLVLQAKNEISNDFFNIINYKEAWKNAQIDCQEQIDDAELKHTLKVIGTLILYLIGFIFIAYILSIVINKVGNYSEKKVVDIKQKIVLSKEKFQEELKAKKIRKIVEEESIRASIRKSMDNSEEDELEDLQNLINKAVASGDSETAQALLKILNSKKLNKEKIWK